MGGGWSFQQRTQGSKPLDRACGPVQSFEINTEFVCCQSVKSKFICHPSLSEPKANSEERQPFFLGGGHIHTGFEGRPRLIGGPRKSVWGIRVIEGSKIEPKKNRNIWSGPLKNIFCLFFNGPDQIFRFFLDSIMELPMIRTPQTLFMDPPISFGRPSDPVWYVAPPPKKKK